MANIDTELAKIKSAIYGKDVRDSIHDAIEAINDEVEAADQTMEDFVQGNLDTTLESSSLPAQGKAVGDVVADLKSHLNEEGVARLLEIASKSGYGQVVPNTQTTAKRIDVVNGKATVSSASTSRYRVADVSVGDILTVQAKSAGVPYNAFIFTDASDNVISTVRFGASQTVGTSYSFYGVVPDGATKAYVNSRGAFDSELYKITYDTLLDANDESVLKSIADTVYYDGAYTALTSRNDSPGTGYALSFNSSNTVTTSSSSNRRTYVFDVTAGKIYKVKHRVSNAATDIIAFSDNNNKLIGYVMHDEVHSDYLYITKAPTDATKMWVVSYAQTPACSEYLGVSAKTKGAFVGFSGSSKPTFDYAYIRSSSATVTLYLPNATMFYRSFDDDSNIAEIGTDYEERSFTIPSGNALVWDIESNTLSVETTVPRKAVLLLWQTYGVPKAGELLHYYDEAYGSGLRNLEDYTGGLREYHKTYCETKLAECREKSLTIGSTGDVFVFVSDTHNNEYNNDQDSPRLIGRIAKGTNIDKVIYGGDMIYAYSSAGESEMLSEMWAQLDAYKKWVSPWVDVYNVIGNHDIHISTAASGGQQYSLTDEEVYSALFREQEDRIIQNENDILGMYYYFDKPKKKLRYICVNSQLSGTQMTNQATWLTSIIASAPAEYSFVVIAHIPMIADHSDDYARNAPLYTVLKTVASRIVGIFAGHVHADLMAIRDGIVHVVILADARVGEHDSGRRTSAAGAFDVVYINTDSKRVDMIRVGAGANRAYKFGENMAILDQGAGREIRGE